MRLPRLSIRDRGLQFKLTLVMLILFACTMVSVFVPYFWGQEGLKKEIEDSFLDLSNAIRVSVDQLTAPAATEEDRLRGYIETLKRSGIREVSIVGRDLGVIDSSNPKKIGKMAPIKLPPQKLVINTTFGEAPGEGEAAGSRRDLIIPVTVAGETLGYIHVRMQIDDFTEPIRKNLYLRFFGTLLIFSFGLALAVAISSHYVRPLEDLAHAAETVAAGDLSHELPVTGRDEVGRLTRSFNEMVVRLRQNRELEERMRETQYLTQLGRLASGMAHEIRNPLNFIGLAIDHLDGLTEPRGAEAGAEKAEVIGRIKEEIRKLNELVTNFVIYGRPAVPQRTSVRIPEIVESVLVMAGDRIRNQKVRCVREIAEGPPFPVDPDMVRRAILNVVINALDAMPDGGELRISAGPSPDEGYALAFEDTGVGIPETDRERIFEPYFTTKSSGLGLGLVLTRKIVEAHGGTIAVDSEPGKGTRIAILLPGGGR